MYTAFEERSIRCESSCRMMCLRWKGELAGSYQTWSAAKVATHNPQNLVGPGSGCR